MNDTQKDMMLEFIRRQEKELSSFVRATLAISESDGFKISCIENYVNNQRKSLNKYEKSLGIK